MKNLCIVFLILILFSCKKDEESPSEVHGLQYYPLKTGKFVVYDVDSTVYTELPKDTLYFKYRIKEKIGEEFTDNQGKRAFRVERYIKHYNPSLSYDSIPWSVKEVWMLNSDNSKILLQENNTVYTRLIFPVIPNASWNGNAYNNSGELVYSYEYADQKKTVGTQPFDLVLKVKQRTDTSNLIQYLLEFEQYAFNFGLVNKEIIQLFSNTITAGVPVKNRIESGFVYKQTYISSGYE